MKEKNMFGIFKKKSPKEKLNLQYKKLLAEAHALSKSNRTASDAKQAEAQKVLEKIEALEK
ncbi:MAG: Lacal_2735 family protein [Vicingaceae bacterium]